MTELLYALQQTALAQAVSKSSFWVGAGLQIVHIFGILLMLGSVLLVSLRLLGLVLADRPVSSVSRTVARFIWTGLGLLVASGTLMFITMPLRYVQNKPFVFKMAFFVAAVLLQLLLFRRVALQAEPSPVLARSAAIATLAVWMVVAWAGRFIGFV